MTNVMHKFLIYLSIYFCLTRFGLSFSPSLEAGVLLRQWFKSPGYGVSAQADVTELLRHYPGGTKKIQENLKRCISCFVVCSHRADSVSGPRLFRSYCFMRKFATV
jgi:hypothetical protein